MYKWRCKTYLVVRSYIFFIRRCNYSESAIREMPDMHNG